MLTSDLSLPDNVKELQIMVVELHEKMEELERNYEVENKLLRERINQLLQELYGRKSEKLSFLLDDGFEQSLLFKDTETDTQEEEENLKELENSEDEEESITIAEHKRKKPGRKSLPDNFERINV